MEACVNAYEMRMPAHYVDLNKEEIEYDGGFWQLFCGLASLACFGASCLVTIAQNAGWIGEEDAHKLTVGLGVAGTVLGVASGVGVLCGAGDIGLIEGLTAANGLLYNPAMSCINTTVHW